MKKSALLSLLCLCAALGFSQTTYSDAAPALYRNCTSCHRVGGGAPFSMLSYADAVPWAITMKTAIEDNEMPPWAPDTSYMHFFNERPLTIADRNTILAWIDDGALEGNPAALPTPPVYPQYLLNGTPDTIINMTPFNSNAGANDAYNTFVIPLTMNQSRYVRAIEIVPGNPDLIHHSIIKAGNAGDVLQNTTGNSFNILGDIALGTWAPGSLPIVFPKSSQLKMGIEIPANGEIIMQIHTPSGTLGQAITCQIRLYFYPIGELGIRPVYDFVPLQYWGTDFVIAPEEIKSFSTEANNFSYDISLFSAFPHSHQICTEILNYAYDPLSTDTIDLIKINNWDFEHQQYYTYKSLIKIPSDYKFHSDHTFDNTHHNHHNPFDPPQLITVGLGSNDEMLFDGFQYITYQNGDELINVDSILTNDPLLNYDAVGISQVSSSIDHNSYVYPNPVKDKSFIHFIAQHKNWNNYALKVWNIKGQLIDMPNKIKNGYFEINRGSLEANIYFYEISDRQKKISSGKIVIQ